MVNVAFTDGKCPHCGGAMQRGRLTARACPMGPFQWFGEETGTMRRSVLVGEQLGRLDGMLNAVMDGMRCSKCKYILLAV